MKKTKTVKELKAFLKSFKNSRTMCFVLVEPHHKLYNVIDVIHDRDDALDLSKPSLVISCADEDDISMTTHSLLSVIDAEQWSGEVLDWNVVVLDQRNEKAFPVRPVIKFADWQENRAVIVCRGVFDD